MTRIALLDDYQSVALGLADWDRLGPHAEVRAFADHLVDPDAIVERLASFDVVVAMRERTPFPASLLERLPHLGLLVTTGMGNASIDMDACRALGITVCGADLGEDQTVELIWALVMSVVRYLPEEDRRVRAGGWQGTLGRELAGSTLGVVGYGTLGSRVARLGRVFGMRVLAWSPSLERGRAPGEGVEAVGFAELFERSDVASVHVRLTPHTRGLIGERELDLLGPRGFLVNTARGPIVREDALVRALHEGRIAGAALDVYDVEPLPAGHPLRTTPHTILSPHIGFVAERGYRRAYTEALEDVEGWLAGRPVRVLAAPSSPRAPRAPRA